MVLLLVAHGVAFEQIQREWAAKQAPPSAAAALELDLCDRCSPELRLRCVCPGERSAHHSGGRHSSARLSTLNSGEWVG